MTDEKEQEVINYDMVLRDYLGRNPPVYYSQAILDMIKDGSCCGQQRYRDTYALRTPLHKQEEIAAFVAYFQEQIQKHITQEQVNAAMPDFTGTATLLKVSVKDLQGLYKALSVRLALQLNTFIGLTVDGHTMGFYDLTHYDSLPLITTEQCNQCGKKEGLLKCKPCKRAAYCSKECQVEDWKFHKQYCRFLQETQQSEHIQEVI